MRVLSLTLEYSPERSGGIGTHALELAQALAARRCEVTVLTYADGRQSIVEDSGVVIHRVERCHARSSHGSIARDILAINRDLIAYGAGLIACGASFDVVQYYGWLTAEAGRALSDLASAPAVGILQYLSDPCEQWWGQAADPEIAKLERDLFRRRGWFVAASESLRSLACAVHGCDPSRIHVVHNGVDLRRFVPADGDAALAERVRTRLRGVLGAGSLPIVFAGRLHPQKGVAAIVDAAALVCAAAPRAAYLLAGECDSRDYGATLRARIAAHGLERRIHLLGKVDRRHLLMLYRGAHLAVMPSVYEPFGYAAIEAMASGTPLVASKVGGLAEIIEDGRSGLLVPVDTTDPNDHRVDVHALADAQLRVLTDAALAGRLAEAGRRRVQDEFSAEQMGNRTLAVYRELVLRHQAGVLPSVARES